MAGSRAPQTSPHAPPLALSMGDPAGIGPEIILKAWTERTARALPPFAVYGDPRLFTERARALSLSIPISEIGNADEAAAQFAQALPVVPVPLAVPARAGAPDARNAAATISSIERAVAAIHAGRASGLVTAPIAKSVLYKSGFAHPGHTEFLAALAERHWPGRHWHPVMMIASDALRVVPLTIHVPLRSVPDLLSRALIEQTARIVWQALADDFGIDNPRLAISGLNPHAGEDGALGTEEGEIIAPAIRNLRQEGLGVTGPHAADTMFHAAARKTYDVAIAMYHDQALIPIKTLAFDEGVNVTLGLPFVRTSPDHGTAFGIAAESRANPSSFLEAIRLAARLSGRRLAQRSTAKS